MHTEQFNMSERLGTKKVKTSTPRKQLIEICDDVFTTAERQLTTYDTLYLLDTFKELKKDGITGIGLSLLIDLADQRAAR